MVIAVFRVLMTLLRSTQEPPSRGPSGCFLTRLRVAAGLQKELGVFRAPPFCAMHVWMRLYCRIDDIERKRGDVVAQ